MDERRLRTPQYSEAYVIDLENGIATLSAEIVRLTSEGDKAQRKIEEAREWQEELWHDFLEQYPNQRNEMLKVGREAFGFTLEA
jgi:hypothetical protein